MLAGGVTHKLIIGDNYPALLNLLISYKRKIKVIYIDPPYGKDHLGEFAKTNYDNAITRDNLLSMLYPRLMLAKQLLRDDGVIFCSIDDRNQAYVKCLFDEVFGERNFISCMCVESAPAGTQSSNFIAQQHSYCLVYAKNISSEPLYKTELSDDELDKKYTQQDKTGSYYIERLWKRGIGGRKEDVPSLHFPVFYDEVNDKIYVDDECSDNDNFIKIIPYQTVGVLGRWTWGKEKMKLERDRLVVKNTNNEWKLYKKEYQNNEQGKLPKSIIVSKIGRTEIGSLELKDIMSEKLFEYPKSTIFIKHLLKISTYPDTDKQDIILDFFAGSGTTGHAVMELNREDSGKRQFILVTNNEKTDINPNGIAYDVTSKRLKRVMTGKCYDGTDNFKWLEKNKPYGDGLEVTEIKQKPTDSQNIFNEIDERLYNKDFKDNIHDKIDWICSEFEITCRKIEGE